MNYLNDAELANLIKAGDLKAFNILYYRYFNAVYSNAFKLTHDTAMSKDIVQEVFIGLWEKRETLHAEKSIAGWLFTCSYHKSINCLRKQVSASKLASLLPAEVFTPERDGIAVENTHALQLQLLQEAILNLSPQKRKVFELCKLEGKSYDQTAAELSISRHTVKEYLTASVAIIKNYIRQHPDYLTGNTATILFISCCIESGMHL